METLHEYLDRIFKGNENVSDADIIAAKKAYQKLYGKQYQKGYSRANRRVRAVVTNEKFNLYTDQAKVIGLKLSDLVKMSLDVACLTGIGSANREVCALSYRLRDMLEEYVHNSGTEELTEAVEITNEIITKSCGH